MAKIVSLNRSKTEDDHHVAFNLDAKPSEGVVDSIDYGTLTISMDWNALVVQAPEDGPAITADTVANLNLKLAEGEAAYAERVQQTEKRLGRLAATLGLPTD